MGVSDWRWTRVLRAVGSLHGPREMGREAESDPCKAEGRTRGA